MKTKKLSRKERKAIKQVEIASKPAPKKVVVRPAGRNNNF